MKFIIHYVTVLIYSSLCDNLVVVLGRNKNFIDTYDGTSILLHPIRIVKGFSRKIINRSSSYIPLSDNRDPSSDNALSKGK